MRCQEEFHPNQKGKNKVKTPPSIARDRDGENIKEEVWADVLLGGSNFLSPACLHSDHADWRPVASTRPQGKRGGRMATPPDYRADVASYVAPTAGGTGPMKWSDRNVGGDIQAQSPFWWGG